MSETLRDSSAKGLEELFLAHLDLLERVIGVACRRHGLSSDETDEFSSTVKTKMIEDGYSVLARFEGRASMKNYLAVVVERLYLDYRNHVWGKWRPSAEARRLGAQAVELDRLLTRDSLTLAEAEQALRNRFGEEVRREWVEATAARLPMRSTRRQREVDSAVLETRAARESPEADLFVHEAQRRRRDVVAQLARAMTSLSPQDRLILKMRMEDGVGIVEIARLLNLPARPLYRRIEAILKGLRQSLEASGVDRGTVREVLEGAMPSLEAPGGGVAAWNSGASNPSLSIGAEE
jgi:RNA polymerase sigma factor (sigma-70 family)